MLFQNSCVVPLGMTAIVSFLPLLPGAPGFVQLNEMIALRAISGAKILRMCFLPIVVNSPLQNLINTRLLESNAESTRLFSFTPWLQPGDLAPIRDREPF